MTDPAPARLYRFGVFEADPATGELRRQGTRIRIHSQPFQLLCLLLEQPGQLFTRDQIAQSLWPSGTHVDFDHGVNSAINRLREALGDTAANPRFVETLARRGYRFIAPVERIPAEPVHTEPDTPSRAASEQNAARAGAPGPSPLGTGDINPLTQSRPVPHSGTTAPRATSEQHAARAGAPGPSPLGTGDINPLTQSRPVPHSGTTAPRATSEQNAARSAVLATPAELPVAPRPVVRTLFVLLQLMYAAFYVGALANLPEIEQLLAFLPWPGLLETALIVTAAALLPVRAFLLTAVLFRPPRAAQKLLRLWFYVAPFDVLWALSPFLLLHHIDFGLALACSALLVYSPFAQRSLVLMGAAGEPVPEEAAS